MNLRVLICCLCWLGYPMLTSALDFTKDSLSTVKKNITPKKAVLVDVRSQHEWDKGHVEGAIFLPITRLDDVDEKQLAKALPQKKISLHALRRWHAGRSRG